MAFNSPEGIRLIDTLKKDMCLAMLSNTFNSPEGIRLIDTTIRPEDYTKRTTLSTPLRELDSLIR